MTKEKEVLAQVTVTQLIEDLSGLPVDAEVFVSVLGERWFVLYAGSSKV